MGTDSTWVSDPRCYACPRSGAALIRERDALRSADGSIEYSIGDGVALFPPVGPGAASEESLVAEARAHGWEAALRKWASQDGHQTRYLTEPRRWAYIDLLRLDASKTVLEIGASLGQHTFRMAALSQRVLALELNVLQAAFVAERARQAGAGNVFVACGGGDCRLPYVTACADVVVMNLVLEWCGQQVEDPVAGQSRMLREAWRVLRPDGILYVCTKNRYAGRLLLGMSDEHAGGMRFGNALPRPIMRFLLRRRGAHRTRGTQRPHGVLHSHRALDRMIRAQGFTRLRSYWALPEMRYPVAFAPTDAASVRSARTQYREQVAEFRRTRLLMRVVPAGLVRHLAPGHVFIAEKAA